MPKISVLITTYNLEKYIEKTLKSVLEQKTEFSYEILVGDDGSTDRTVKIVEEVSREYHVFIPVYKMKRSFRKEYNPIYRASKNRVNLIRHAKGEYITFLDGDDFYISKEMLQKLCKKLEQQKECIMCAGDLLLYQENSHTYKRVIAGQMKTGIIKKQIYWKKYWLHAECFLFRNIFIIDPILKMNPNVFDDNLITFYFMKFGEIYYIDEPMVAYRQNRTPWKQKSNLEKHIYNAMDLSEELRINSKMWFSSFIRHYMNFVCLIQNSDKISQKDYRKIIKMCQENRYYIIDYILKKKMKRCD